MHEAFRADDRVKVLRNLELRAPLELLHSLQGFAVRAVDLLDRDPASNDLVLLATLGPGQLFCLVYMYDVFSVFLFSLFTRMIRNESKSF